MVKHIRSLEDFYVSGAWLTIGSFDGVHLGHQEIIRKLVSGAKINGDLSVVVTFYPHPMVVLRDRKDAFYLTTPDERARILGELGVDIVFTHQFNKQVASLSARDFIYNLKSHFGLRQLWIGHDFALGHDREGDVDRLRELGLEFDFVVNVLQPVKINGQVASSSLIRNFIREGNIQKANEMLGRHYQLEGIVIEGDGRGKTIGIPTANLDIGDEKLCPANGVYACIGRFSEEVWPAATNIGYRPTFDGNDVRPHVETHIIGYHGNLYGKKLELRFLSRLRAEQKFDSVQELIQQIEKDIQSTKSISEEYIMTKTSN